MVYTGITCFRSGLGFGSFVRLVSGYVEVFDWELRLENILVFEVLSLRWLVWGVLEFHFWSGVSVLCWLSGLLLHVKFVLEVMIIVDCMSLVFGGGTFFSCEVSGV